MLRVAHVVHGLGDGGLEALTAGLARRLRGRGHHVAVFCTTMLGFHADALRADGVEVVDCRSGRARIPAWPRRLMREVRSFRPTIIHAHSGAWYPATLAAARVRPVPVLVFTDHGRYPHESWWNLRFQRWCASRTAAIVAVSAAAAETARTRLRLAGQPVVVENGVDLERAVGAGTRERLRAEWGVDETEVLAITVGRLEPIKNHMLLLESLARARRDGARLALIMLGEGALEAQLRAAVARLGLGEHVHFGGFRSDVSDCLAAADLFVLPSLSEGLPLSLLEAMASGKAIVASSVGGIPSALGEPAAGILVPAGDGEALTAALTRLGAEASLRHDLGSRALAQVRRFGLERTTDEYLAVYYRALASVHVSGSTGA